MKNAEYIGFCIDRINFAMSYKFPKDNLYKNGFKKQLYDKYKNYPIKRIEKMISKGKTTMAYYRERVVNEAINDGKGLLTIKVNLSYPYQALIYMNPNLLWRNKNKNYELRGLHGQNYMPPWIDRKENLKIYLEYKKKAINSVLSIWRNEFELQVDEKNVDYTYYITEIAQEYLGHAYDLKRNLDRIFGVKMVEFHNLTFTTYVNKLPIKGIQLKMYQKSPEIVRLEWTLTEEWSKNHLCYNTYWELYYSIENLLKILAKQCNLSDMRLHNLDGEWYIHVMEQFLNLPNEDIRLLLHTSVFEIDKSQQSRKGKFLRRGLIRKGLRGLYYPTPILLGLQYIYEEFAIKNKPLKKQNMNEVKQYIKENGVE